MRDAWRGLALGLGFLTRIPAPNIASPVPRAFAWALFWFPAIGAVLGATLGLVQAGGEALGLGAQPLAAVLVALWAATTGALHLDGVADTFDGLSGGRTPAARLEIMRDSRIGAHGATALVLILLLKFAFLSSLIEQSSGKSLGIMGAMVVARFVAVGGVALYRYASPGGLGTAFKDSAGPWSVGTASLWCLLLPLVAPAPLHFGLATAITVPLASCLAWFFSRRLNGLNGDTYGALIESSEVIFLFLLLLL